MKEKLLFLFAVLTLRGSPQSGDIDTLYYVHSFHFFPEYYGTNVHFTIYNLSLQSPVSSWQKVKVYDVLGNEIATLVDEYKPARRYELEFSYRGGLSIGICSFPLRVGDYFAPQKMIRWKWNQIN